MEVTASLPRCPAAIVRFAAWPDEEFAALARSNGRPVESWPATTLERDLNDRRQGSLSMSRCYREPTVAEALADPLIRLVMKADGVDPDALGASLQETAAKFARHRSHGDARTSCCG